MKGAEMVGADTPKSEEEKKFMKDVTKQANTIAKAVCTSSAQTKEQLGVLKSMSRQLVELKVEIQGLRKVQEELLATQKELLALKQYEVDTAREVRKRAGALPWGHNNASPCLKSMF